MARAGAAGSDGPRAGLPAAPSGGNAAGDALVLIRSVCGMTSDDSLDRRPWTADPHPPGLRDGLSAGFQRCAETRRTFVFCMSIPYLMNCGFLMYALRQEVVFPPAAQGQVAVGAGRGKQAARRMGERRERPDDAKNPVHVNP